MEATVVTAHAGRLTAAALFFPTEFGIAGSPLSAGGALAPLADQIDVQSGADFVAAWTVHAEAVVMRAGLGTPLQEAFDRADVGPAESSLSGPTTVVVITDGEPNCFSDATLTGVPTDTEPNRAAAWLADGIETWVIGLPGANGILVLQDIANAAGTTLIGPADADAMRAELERIFAEPCP
ncbi:MAG: hypothetical protein OEZ06_13660 [Myxococcales bacterium]|nr:hypothetical protein [Myxococcales bacterium]